MASVIYNAAKKYWLDGLVDMDTDTLKVMLVGSGYTPNIDTHEFRDDITGEVSGTGYTAGGATLAGQSVAVDTDNDSAVFDANNVTWGPSSITARGAVVYKSRGGASSADELLFYFDFGVDRTSADGDFKILWNEAGIVALA